MINKIKNALIGIGAFTTVSATTCAIMALNKNKKKIAKKVDTFVGDVEEKISASIPVSKIRHEIDDFGTYKIYIDNIEALRISLDEENGTYTMTTAAQEAATIEVSKIMALINSLKHRLENMKKAEEKSETVEIEEIDNEEDKE